MKAHNPIIQNVVKGAFYCAKRGGLSYAEAVRPKNYEDDTPIDQICPTGYIPCNEKYLEQMKAKDEIISIKTMLDQIVCRPESEKQEDYYLDWLILS